MQQMQRELFAFLGAVRFFTRIPVSCRVPHSNEYLNHSARYFPAVGVLVGALSAIAFSIALLFLPLSIAILIAMATSIYITGAFHEDGLSDMTDGLGGGWEWSIPTEGEVVIHDGLGRRVIPFTGSGGLTIRRR